MQRLLLIKPSSLGDIIHGLLIARAIKAQRPHAHLTWVAREAFAPLVEASTDVDRVLVFERKGGVGAFLRLLRAIRRERFDAVLEMQGLARSALMAAAARAPLKLGRADAREGLTRFVTRPVALPEGGREAHAVTILRGFPPALGLEDRLGGPPKFRPPDEPPPDLPEPAPVVLFPDSRRPEKQWPHFPALTGYLLQRHEGLPVIWAGSAAAEVPADLAAHTDFHNLVGRTSLPQLAALLSRARLVIANDSGPMHLAAALERPLLALFGPTSPERFGPYPLESPRHTVLRARDGHLAMLEPSAVAQTVDTLLAAGTSEGR